MSITEKLALIAECERRNTERIEDFSKKRERPEMAVSERLGERQ